MPAHRAIDEVAADRCDAVRALVGPARANVPFDARRSAGVASTEVGASGARRRVEDRPPD